MGHLFSHNRYNAFGNVNLEGLRRNPVPSVEHGQAYGIEVMKDRGNLVLFGDL